MPAKILQITEATITTELNVNLYNFEKWAENGQRHQSWQKGHQIIFLWKLYNFLQSKIFKETLSDGIDLKNEIFFSKIASIRTLKRKFWMSNKRKWIYILSQKKKSMDENHIDALRTFYYVIKFID